MAAASQRNHPIFSTPDNDSWRTPFMLDPSAAGTVDPTTAAAAAAMFYPIDLGDSRMFGRINVPANQQMRQSQAGNNNVSSHGVNNYGYNSRSSTVKDSNQSNSSVLPTNSSLMTPNLPPSYSNANLHQSFSRSHLPSNSNLLTNAFQQQVADGQFYNNNLNNANLNNQRSSSYSQAPSVTSTTNGFFAAPHSLAQQNNENDEFMHPSFTPSKNRSINQLQRSTRKSSNVPSSFSNGSMQQQQQQQQQQQTSNNKSLNNQNSNNDINMQKNLDLNSSNLLANAAASMVNYITSCNNTCENNSPSPGSVSIITISSDSDDDEPHKKNQAKNSNSINKTQATRNNNVSQHTNSNSANNNNSNQRMTQKNIGPIKKERLSRDHGDSTFNTYQDGNFNSFLIGRDENQSNTNGLKMSSSALKTSFLS
jgi:hypothetical protein